MDQVSQSFTFLAVTEQHKSAQCHVPACRAFRWRAQVDGVPSKVKQPQLFLLFEIHEVLSKTCKCRLEESGPQTRHVQRYTC